MRRNLGVLGFQVACRHGGCKFGPGSDPAPTSGGERGISISMHLTMSLRSLKLTKMNHVKWLLESPVCAELAAWFFDVQLIIEEKGNGRFVTLNRPRVLNCINLSMVFHFPRLTISSYYRFIFFRFITCLALMYWSIEFHVRR